MMVCRILMFMWSFGPLGEGWNWTPPATALGAGAWFSELHCSTSSKLLVDKSVTAKGLGLQRVQVPAI